MGMTILGYHFGAVGSAVVTTMAGMGITNFAADSGALLEQLDDQSKLLGVVDSYLDSCPGERVKGFEGSFALARFFAADLKEELPEHTSKNLDYGVECMLADEIDGDQDGIVDLFFEVLCNSVAMETSVGEHVGSPLLVRDMPDPVVSAAELLKLASRYPKYVLLHRNDDVPVLIVKEYQSHQIMASTEAGRKRNAGFSYKVLAAGSLVRDGLGLVIDGSSTDMTTKKDRIIVSNRLVLPASIKVTKKAGLNFASAILASALGSTHPVRIDPKRT